MPEIQVRITRFVGDAFPGFAEFELFDAHGECHRFLDKLPVVTQQDLHESSAYPLTEWVLCEVLRSVEGALADRLRIEMARPWALESKEGRTEFEVLASQVR